MPVRNPGLIYPQSVFAGGGPILSSSYTNIPGLVVPIAIGERIYFDATIHYVSSAAGNGLGLSCNGPSGATIKYQLALQAIDNSTTGNNTTNAGFFVWRCETNFDSMTATTTVPSTNKLTAFINGVIVNGGTAGDFAIRLRSEAASPSFISIGSDSRMLIWRI